MSPSNNQKRVKHTRRDNIDNVSIDKGKGNIIIGNRTGEIVGRDRNVESGSGGVVIGGSVSGSTIIAGNNNVVGNISTVFHPIYRAVEESKHPPVVKEDLKAEVQEMEAELEKGDEANESFLSRRLRNIQRMAPDILDVALAAFANPIAGLGMVAKKVAEKMKAEAG